MFFKRFFGQGKKDKIKKETTKPSRIPTFEVPKPKMVPNKMGPVLFYKEEDIIVDEFNHFKTTQKILDFLKNAVEPPKKERYGGYEISFSYNSSSKDFIKESIKFANKTHPKCPMPPFQAYYSTFSDMNNDQKNWYFYWRERALNGEYLPADLSYIYVFVYELINYSFNQNAAFNVSMLFRLYEAYKQQHHIERFIPLIGDMLYELGEYRLAEKWSPNKPQIPPLYKQLQEKADDLSRISITSWKSYLLQHRESKFFTANKNKIYKTFKECLHLLEDSHVKRTNQKLIDVYFEKRKEKQRRYLFSGLVSIRDQDNFIQFDIVNIYPTQQLHAEVAAFFKLSENVTRLLNNEKRQLQVDERVIPAEVKDSMLEYLSRPKESGRFKTVQKKTDGEAGSAIPPRPEERPKVIIEFDDERIKQLKSETESLVDEVEKRAQEHQEENNDNNSNTKNQPPKEEEKQIETDESTGGLNKFFSGGGDNIDDDQIQAFINNLTDVEKEFIKQFKDLEWSKNDAIPFLKSKGQMLGVIMSSLNEKAQEHLEDNFVEEDGEDLTIYEEFEPVTNLLKER